MPEQTESTPDSKIKAKADLVTIALVGRPNVGKSTLFNRLIRSRKALVAPIPGTTRDRREAVVKNNRFRFQLVDTGGMAFDSREAFSKEIKQQIESALGQADLIWFMLDSKEGLNPFDTEMYRWLLKLGKPVMVLINKIDTPGKEVLVSEFHALGTESLFSVSATHGLGMDGLLEHSAELFPAIRVDEEEEETDEKPLRVAFLGQPNVGKS
ncbi:MAG: 50S ribosome-binding GTPase, partial [Deltaproteobacteria bacterium]|nr:50S ribosome-binding GTPase [Deltaproteobacteria bacterium]